MKFLKNVVILLFIVTMVSFSNACAGKRVHYVRTAPPARKVVVVSKARPYKNAVWRNGYWKWHRNKYVWENGKWLKPRAGFIWIDGHWKKTPHGWQWIDGHWKKR